MSFFNPSRRHPVLEKVVACILAIVVSISSFHTKGILTGIGMLAIALMFAYEAYAIGIQHRSVKTLERIPFIAIFIVLMIVDTLQKVNGSL